jgi:hypothetical protein
VHVKVLTVTRAEDGMSYQMEFSVSQRVCKCAFFQETLSIFKESTTNLLNQFSELNELREQLRKAQLSARPSQQPMRRAEKNAN